MSGGMGLVNDSLPFVTGVGEPKLRRVQRLPMKLQFLQHLAVRLSRTAVDGVADQRVADRCHVDADLMGSARLQTALDQSGVLQHVKPLPVRHGALSAFPLDDGDLLPVGRRAGEGGIDDALAHPSARP